MSSPQILVRKLDSNHDPIYGNGKADFLSDLYAVAQLIQTSLLLFQGEWWNNLSVGFPLFQQVLGTPNASRQPQLIALLVQQTILGSSTFVQQVLNVQTSYTPATRTFAYQCDVETSFGTLSVSFQPGSVAILPTS